MESRTSRAQRNLTRRRSLDVAYREVALKALLMDTDGVGIEVTMMAMNRIVMAQGGQFEIGEIVKDAEDDDQDVATEEIMVTAAMALKAMGGIEAEGQAGTGGQGEHVEDATSQSSARNSVPYP